MNDKDQKTNRKPTNYGRLSLVIGILAIAFGIYAIAIAKTPFMPLINGICAIICGIISLCKKTEKKAAGVVGIVLGTVGIAIAIPFLGILFYLFN